MRTCPNCHATLQDDAIFCDHCGMRLERNESVQTDNTASRDEMVDDTGLKLLDKDRAPGVGFSYPIQENMCPTCGWVNKTGDRYCVVCGFWLVSWEKPVPGEQPPPVFISRTEQSTSVMPPVEIAAAELVIGKLYSLATRAEFLIHPRLELLIGRGDPGRGIVPDIDLSKEGSASNSVSRKHARLIIHGNQVYIEDLSSTNGTYLNKQKLQPSQRYLVHHGDELRFGAIVLIFYTK